MRSKPNQERNLEKMKRIKIEERNFFNKSILKELKYKKISFQSSKILKRKEKIMFFFSKNRKKPIVDCKKIVLKIKNTDNNNRIKITLKPIHAVYYNKEGKLEEIVIPRFFFYEVVDSYEYRNKRPINQAIAIEKSDRYHLKKQEENWFQEILYVTKDELERYSVSTNVKLELQKMITKTDAVIEKIEFKTEHFQEDLWYWESDKNHTCAKIYDFYHNMDKEIIKAFGNGLFDSLKTYLELYDELGKYSVKESRKEVCSYVNQIYETALSMGETLEEFPTVIDYINIKNEEDLKKKQEELDRKQKLKEKQNQLIRDLKLRQSLLNDFNAPLECNKKAT